MILGVFGCMEKGASGKLTHVVVEKEQLHYYFNRVRLYWSSGAEFSLDCINCVYLCHRVKGEGIWFCLHDGRIFNAFGEHDPTLSDGEFLGWVEC